MKKHILYIILLLFFIHPANGQSNPSWYYKEYFDGDSLPPHVQPVPIEWVQPEDTGAVNIWQVGPPQKIIFDSAATLPNALVTDTINNYPVNNKSSFIIKYHRAIHWGIWAIRWKQKLDMERKSDGGMVEFSLDTGQTWQNAFNNPLVYNFYGYSHSNIDTLSNGAIGFTGTDSTWKDIWLCFSNSYTSVVTDTVLIRFTIVSDSVESDQEGWMIDNMMMNLTQTHTISKVPQEEYLNIYPTFTTGRVNIDIQKSNRFNVIDFIQVIDAKGTVVKKYDISPTHYYIDLNELADGLYFLKIKSTLGGIITRKVQLQH